MALAKLTARLIAYIQRPPLLFKETPEVSGNLQLPRTRQRKKLQGERAGTAGQAVRGRKGVALGRWPGLSPRAQLQNGAAP